MNQEIVWVFHGMNSRFSGGIFTTLPLAEDWIAKHRLTGLLTAYPLDTGIYDWAIAGGLFEPKKPEHDSPNFIGGFTTAGQEHQHYEDGKRS
ncbi:DUF7710 domain-containing protein [Chitinophaga rhizophila]|uniref:DUF7710 domain-containing protein n=1 Tax=Chitinophaga rhizophila TaxID=2866212 RepID=A0ABS7GHI2_9BACT|nr:hypothetical protein [Chitinophaga rhizophila]MBW8687154.1 hypothetical protein [Chitinophaga rhizophila]